MLKVIAGDAAPVLQRLLVESFLQSGGTDGTAFIVPDRAAARALRNSWAVKVPTLRTGAISSLDAITDQIVLSGYQKVLRPPERLVVLRQLLHEMPSTYDWLVGRNSVPHLTYGVLRRISDALGRLQSRDEQEEMSGEITLREFEHPRVRQLRALGEAYRKRLAAADAVDSRTAQRQAWASLTAEALSKVLPSAQLIVFFGFVSLDELTMLAMHRLRDVGPDVMLLLPYHPENDSDAYCHLNESYARLFDMADSITLDPPNVGEATGATQPNVQLIAAPSRKAEVCAIAHYLRSQLDSTPAGQPFDYHQHVIAFPRIDSYEALVRETFSDYGLPHVIEQSLRVLEHPLVRLLQTVRDALTSAGSITAIRALFKSPFLTPLLGTTGSAVTVSTLAQLPILDRLRRAEGITSSGKAILTDIHQLIARLAQKLSRMEERATGDDESPDLAALRTEISEYRMLTQTIDGTLEFIDTLRSARTLEKWNVDLRVLLEICASSIHPDEGELCSTSELALPFLERVQLAEAHLHISNSMEKLAEFSPLLTTGPVSFSSYLGSLRVMLRECRLCAHTKFGHGFRVVPITVVAFHQPNVLLLGGLVDGEVPQYNTREARLDDFDPPVRQKQNIAHQRSVFHQSLNAAGSEVLLFAPASDSDGELLESQFIEELQQESEPELPAVHSDTFCNALPGNALPASQVLQRISEAVSTLGCDSIAALQGRETSAAEQTILENITHSLCAEHDRHASNSLGNFDGFIYEPALVQYLQQRTAAHVHSVSQLDALVQCPFRYFVQYILQVSEPEEKEERTAPREAGILAHAILHGFYSEWVGMGNSHVTATNRADAAHLIATHAQRQLQAAQLSPFEHDCLSFRLFGSAGAAGLLGTATAGAAPLHGIRDYPGMLAALLDLEIERSENSAGERFQPTFFELGFGLPSRRDGSQDAFSMSEPIELELPGDEVVRLRGRADRIDTGSGHFSVVDYKTGASPNITEQKQGFKVQLPVYLMALERLLDIKDRPLQPAGGMFVRITPTEAEVTGQFFRKTFLGAAGISNKRGMSDEDFSEAQQLVRYRLADGLQRIREGRFHVTIAGEKIACGYCNNAAICRKDLPRVERLVPLVCG